MESSAQQFKQGLDKAYTSKAAKSASPGGMMTDMVKYSSEMKEQPKKKPNSPAYKGKEGYDDSCDCYKSDKKTKKIKKNAKQETDEATGTGSSGAFEGPLFGGETEFAKKSDSETPKLDEGIATGAMGLDKVEAKEATGSGSVGGYSSPAMWAKSTSKKDWGPSRKTQIPGGGFVKVKKKCSKFPYCNQGDINALKISKNESVKEAIKNVAKTMGISENVIKTILEHEYEKNQKRSK